MDIDLGVLRRSFSKASNSYAQHAHMQNIMAKELCAYLTKALKDHRLSHRVLEIGCGPGNFTKILLDNLEVKELCLNDLSPSMISSNLASLEHYHHIAISSVCANALDLSKDQANLVKPFDLIVSNATFQWFDDLSGALYKLSSLAHDYPYAIDLSATNKSGRLIAFSSFYEGNFAQIKELTGLSLNYLNKEQIVKVLDSCTCDYQVYFGCHEQYFTSALELFKNLKDTGVTALNNKPMTPSSFKELLFNYEQHFTSEQGVGLTWCPYYVIALM